MDGVKVCCHPRREVPDRKLQLNADAPRTWAAQRREEVPVDGGGKFLDCVWRFEHFSILYYMGPLERKYLVSIIPDR